MFHSYFHPMYVYAISMILIGIQYIFKWKFPPEDEKDVKIGMNKTGSKIYRVISIVGIILMVYILYNSIFPPDHSDKAAKKWKMSGKENKVTAVSLNSNADKFAVAVELKERDNQIGIYDIKTGKFTDVKILEDKRCLQAMDWGKGNVIASTSENTVKLWDAETGEMIRSFRAHESGISSLCFTRDLSYLLTADADGICKIWNTESWELYKTIPDTPSAKQPGKCTKLAVTSDNSIIALGFYDNIIQLWSFETASLLNTIIDTGADLTSIEFNNAGTILASCSYDARLKLWSVESGNPIANVESVDCPTCLDAFNTIKFTPDDKIIITSAKCDPLDEKGIMFWNAETHEKNPYMLIGHRASDIYFDMPPDCSFIISAGSDGVKFWDLKDPEKPNPFVW